MTQVLLAVVISWHQCVPKDFHDPRSEWRKQRRPKGKWETEKMSTVISWLWAGGRQQVGLRRCRTGGLFIAAWWDGSKCSSVCVRLETSAGKNNSVRVRTWAAAWTDRVGVGGVASGWGKKDSRIKTLLAKENKQWRKTFFFTRLKMFTWAVQSCWPPRPPPPKKTTTHQLSAHPRGLHSRPQSIVSTSRCRGNDASEHSGRRDTIGCSEAETVCDTCRGWLSATTTPNSSLSSTFFVGAILKYWTTLTLKGMIKIQCFLRHYAKRQAP